MLTCAVAPSLAHPAQSITRLKVATSVTPPSIHNLFLHVAHERGFFRANGIEVTEFIQLGGGPLAIQALAAGEVDVATADPEGLLAAVLAGHRLRAVAAPGARLSYMVAVGADIRALADLRGRRFAISRPGAISQYLMYPLLDRAQVPRDSLQWYGVGGARERLLALQAGRVDGALLMVDFALEAASDPKLRILSRLADILPEYPVELLVLRSSLIERNPTAAAAVVRAVIQACRYIVANKAGTLDVHGKYALIANRALRERAYDELKRIGGFGVNGGMTGSNLKAAHDLALRNRQISRPVPLVEWADFRFQERALLSLGRYPG